MRRELLSSSTGAKKKLKSCVFIRVLCFEVEKKLEVLQSRHDYSNSISAAEKGEIA